MNRFRSPLQTIIFLFAACGTFTGCANVQHPPTDHATKHVGVPERFAESRLGVSSGDEIPAGWLSNFDDPILASLVQEAWEHNPDLYTAASRFEEAAARIRVAASYLSPRLNGGVGTQYQYNDGSQNKDQYSASLGASWEVDLWGRLGSDRAFAQSVANATGLEYLQARHSIAAAVTQAYYEIVSAKAQLVIDRQLLEAERFTAETTKQRVDAGLGTPMDVDLAESSVRLADASVHNDLAVIREARRGLELLLGRYPSAELDAASETLPQLIDDSIAIGVPSALIERRPDIRSAEIRVDAAFYDVESARAAKLPQLTLSADMTTMLDPSELISTIAADILAPIFQGGRLDALESAASARQQQAIGSFAAVALRAFSEVESSLSNIRALDARELLLSEASGQLQRASESAVSRYEQGLIPILDLQQIRRQDFQTRSLLLAVRYEQIRQRLNLYLALGGPVIVGDTETVFESDGGMIDPESSDFHSELHVGIPDTQRAQHGKNPEANHDDQE